MTIDPAIAGQTAAMLVTYSRHFPLDTASEAAQDARVTLETNITSPSIALGNRVSQLAEGDSFPSPLTRAPAESNDPSAH